jgi:hypothetical protein
MCEHRKGINIILRTMIKGVFNTHQKLLDYFVSLVQREHPDKLSEAFVLFCKNDIWVYQLSEINVVYRLFDVDLNPEYNRIPIEGEED